MNARLFVVGVMLASLIATSVPAHAQSSTAESAEQLDRVLVFSATGWYRHPEIPVINGWLVRFGEKHGIRMDVSESAQDITRDNLRRYDVVLLNNANALDEVLNEEQRQALQHWYRNDGAIVATHAAFVHQTEWDWFHDLAGTDFNSDSEFTEATVVVDPEAKDHPAVAGYGPTFEYTADWTNHTKSVTGMPGVQVLLRVDESTYDAVRDYFETRGGEPMGEDHPIAWTRVYDGGRLFYTELGHDLRSLDTEFGRTHLLGGLRWVAGVAQREEER